MGRREGVRNKTPEELKLEAEIKLLEMNLKTKKQRLDELVKERTEKKCVGTLK